MIGLALSGGGYRASLFHLGVMARLADEGLLKEVQALSTVSGGSIVGAFYYKMLCEELRNDRPLTDQDYRDLMQRVIRAFVAVVQEDLRNRVVITGGISRLVPEPILKRLLGLVHKVVPTVNPAVILDSKLEQGMKDLMFQTTVLRDLMDPPVHPENRKPELILNTSILENGQPLFISTNPTSLLWGHNERNHAIRADEMINLPLSKAVAASACVPGLFNPITIPSGIVWCMGWMEGYWTILAAMPFSCFGKRGCRSCSAMRPSRFVLRIMWKSILLSRSFAFRTYS